MERMNYKEIIFSKYDLSNLTDEDKGVIIKEFSELVAFQCLDLFNALGLKTHIEANIVNQPDGAKYKLSFTKQ